MTKVCFPEKNENCFVPIEIDSTVLQTIKTILDCYSKGNRTEKFSMDPESVIF
jgi:hypothetical protein